MIAPSRAELLVTDAERYLAATRAKAAGKLVVGLVGAVVPSELVVAAGCTPVTLTARAADWGLAAEPMEEEHEAEVRSLFRQAVAGEFEFCDLMVLPSTSDGLRYLFQYLKEMQRTGRGQRIPPLVCYDFLFGRSPAVRRYSAQVFDEFAHRLSILTGAPIGDEALRRAIVTGNAVRAQLQRLNELRRAGRVSGCAAQQALRAGAFLDPGDYLARLSAWIDARAADPRLPASPRLLLVPAVPLYHDRLHQLVESAGALVVGEDDEWGANWAGAAIDPTQPPATALFSHYYDHAWSQRMPRAQRERWYTEQVQAGAADGVVFYLPPSDQFFGWRYPALKTLAEGAGLRTLLIREDALDPAATATITDKVRGFLAGGRP